MLGIICYTYPTYTGVQAILGWGKTLPKKEYLLPDCKICTGAYIGTILSFQYSARSVDAHETARGMLNKVKVIEKRYDVPYLGTLVCLCLWGGVIQGHK